MSDRLEAARRERDRLADNLGRLEARYRAEGRGREARSFGWAGESLRERNDLRPYRALWLLDDRKPFPVDIDTFLEDPEFLGYLKGEFGVWDAHRDRVRDMNPDVVCGEAPVTESALGGASGTGKTTLAWINLCYQFYLLTCFRNPQRLFNLAPVTPIVFTVQSLSQATTKLVIYTPLRTMLTSMPYVQRWCNWDRHREGQLDFQDNTHIIPALARGTSLQGQAVIGGILDELSFMAVIEASKQVAGPRGLGGRFDQAEEVYNQTMNRRARSFGRGGVSIGSVCALSNTCYRGDFMDRHLDFLDEQRPDGVLHWRLRRYEVEPGDVRDVRQGHTIRVQVGTDYHPTKVLVEDEEPDDGAEVVLVPARYRLEFLRDPDKALREIVGVSSAAVRPFLRQRGVIFEAVDRAAAMGLRQWVDVADADLTVHGMPEWVPENIPGDRALRYVHVDLSKSRDRCGIAVVKPTGLQHIRQTDGTVKTVPSYAVECVVTLTPSGNAEVEPAVVRDWVMRLSTEHGVQIGGVSYDGFQSQESLQVLRRSRVFATEVSMDRTMEPYEYLRSTLYEGRVAILQNDILLEELVMLEYNAEKDKVDHPPKGSKDAADAVCGAIYNCSQQRTWRTQTGYYDDEEDESVSARGDKNERPRRQARPKSKVARRTRKGDKYGVQESRKPQLEQGQVRDLSGHKTVDPPQWWKDKHGLDE